MEKKDEEKSKVEEITFESLMEEDDKKKHYWIRGELAFKMKDELRSQGFWWCPENKGWHTPEPLSDEDAELLRTDEFTLSPVISDDFHKEFMKAEPKEKKKKKDKTNYMKKFEEDEIKEEQFDFQRELQGL